ncbi:MAG: hypothetical protein ABIP38_15530 [Steroidobacteraceae bacterium]
MRRSASFVLGMTFLALAACKQKPVDKPVVDTLDRHDFSGTWDRYPAPTDASRDPTVVPAPSPIPPPPLKPEFKAAYEAAQKKIDAANKAGEPIANNYTHCIPDGMPTMMQAMFPMEVLQTKRQTTIIQEAYNQVRRIYMDDTLPAIEDAEPGFWGHSTGKWEGNDFVVETIGIKEHVRFRNTPHSPAMRIHERMRVIDADHFEDDVTVEDPEYLTGPWTWTWKYQRRPNYKIYEYVCEDNREFADPATGKQRMRMDPQ